MSQPPIFTPPVNFLAYARANPAAPINPANIDSSFAAVQASLNPTIENLGIIQRDDGALANSIVTPDSLNTATINMIGEWNPRGAWVTATNYAVLDMVTPSGGDLTYVCNTAHTSGASFSIDLALGYWQLVNGTGAIASTGVQFTTNNVILGRATAGAGDGEEIVCTANGRGIIATTSPSDTRNFLGLGSASNPTFGNTTVSALLITGLTSRSMIYADASKIITSAVANDGQLLIGDTGGVPLIGSITGTVNQVTVTNGPGSITLSLPQDIATTSSPTFANLTVTGDEVIGGDLDVAGTITSPSIARTVFNYMTDAQIADVQARTFLLDVSTPLINAFADGVGTMLEGGYLCNASVIVPVADGLQIRGSGSGQVEVRFASDVQGISLTFSDVQQPPSIEGVTITTLEALKAVTSITRVGATATVTTTAPHGFSNGATVAIGGANQLEYNIIATITTTGASTFTYAVSGAPTTPATGTILCQLAITGLEVEMSPLVLTTYRQGPLIADVVIRGQNTTTMGWSKQILATGLWYPTIANVTLKGYSVSGAAFNNYHTLFGIHLSDCMVPILQNVIGQHINECVYENGSTLASEGFVFNNCQFIGVRTGFNIGNGVASIIPGGVITNCNFDCSYRGVVLNWRVQAQINNNLIYRTATTTEGWIGILAATNCGNNQFYANTFENSSTDVTSCSGLWLSDSSDNTIWGLIADNFNAAGGIVVLEAASSRNEIDARSFVSGPTGTALTNVVLGGGFTGTGNQINDPEATITTLTQNSTTPSVDNAMSGAFVTNNTNPTAYTDFTNGYPGQVITVQVADANSSFVNGATLVLRPAVNFVSASGDILTFRRYAGGVWREIGRRASAGNFTTISASTSIATGGFLQRTAPVTETGATRSVGATDNFIICNRAGTVTLTLPTASANIGRDIWVSTITANTVVSASGNVIPRAGGAAGTAILAATAGNWAMLVSDGTNWNLMAGTP